MPKNIVLSKSFYVADSELHGKGLFAARRILAAEYMGTFRGPETKKDGTHVLWIEQDNGKYIGRIGKNILRYMNHSDDPCSEFEGFELYALRSIKKHEEITIDYGWDE